MDIYIYPIYSFIKCRDRGSSTQLLRGYNPFHEKKERRAMNITQATKTCLLKSFKYSGRASRSEYWNFQLSSFFIRVIPILLFFDYSILFVATAVNILVNIVLIPAALSSFVRRLHDVDRSGWWIFISLIPVFGAFLLLVWTVTRGTEGPNRFGGDPLATDDDTYGAMAASEAVSS
jgi:uncharacterized membrane protein YhaH (DUF805 family)